MDIGRGLQIPVGGLGFGWPGVPTNEREPAATDGVLRVCVSPATETANGDYDPGGTDEWVFAGAIERAGYRPGRPVES